MKMRQPNNDSRAKAAALESELRREEAVGEVKPRTKSRAKTDNDELCGGGTIVPPGRISTLQVIHSLFAAGFREVEAEQTQLRFVKVKADGDEMEFELESSDETLRGRAWVPLREVMGGWKWGWKEIKLPLIAL